MRTKEELCAFFADDRFALEVCGITIDHVDEEYAQCSMPITPMHLNAGGVAQGGAVYTLCDTTFAVAANARGVLTVSQNAAIHYLRPATGSRLRAQARCIGGGRATCLYRVDVWDDRERLVAFATVTGFRKSAPAQDERP